MSGWAVETVSLSKTFRKKKTAGKLVRHPFTPGRLVRALEGVSLRIPHREIFGLLGPNGAGKTTLIKILSSLVLPTSGRAAIHGHDAGHDRASRHRLGLVTSDERSFYWRLTGRENLRFFARLHGLDGATRTERTASLLARLDLDEAADKAFSTYSSGMKQRLAVARALLHDPPVLLLDEPTRAFRGTLFRGESLAAHWPDLFWLAAFSAVIVPAGLLMARLAIQRARVEGTLVQY